MNLPKQVTVVEVGPRDGFQIETEFIPTEDKIKVIDQISETGFTRIEATSFTHPRAIPQLADAAEVMARIKRKPGIVYEALVPNAKGVERAIEARVEHVGLVISASESHNKKNVNMTIAESMQTLTQAIKMALSNGMTVTGGIACVFGCSIEGWVPPQNTDAIVDEFLSLGVHEISLGDTVGMATPVQVSEWVSRYLEKLKGTGVGLRLHFHDTRGAGLANVLAAMQAGATIFDTSICGLGGCPYAPGATGNIASSDTVHMLEAMGIETGIDLQKLIECERAVRDLLRRPVHSEVLKAGPIPWLMKNKVS